MILDQRLPVDRSGCRIASYQHLPLVWKYEEDIHSDKMMERSLAAVAGVPEMPMGKEMTNSRTSW
jgi:hypothetical protein